MRRESMVFCKDFFDLQFSFAEKVRDLSSESLETTLLDYTNFYVRFGFGRDFNAENESWRHYLAGLPSANDGRDWTYRYYLREPEAKTAPPAVATFGCFSYELRDGGAVRLHFRDSDSDCCSPLATARVERRRAELAALFAHLMPNISQDAPIVGASWLYNLRAYRRLFPPAYVASARPIRNAFRSMPLWGQFLNRRGEIREPTSKAFLNALAQAPSLSEVGRCFPLQALGVSAPAREFADFYGIRVVANSRPTRACS